MESNKHISVAYAWSRINLNTLIFNFSYFTFWNAIKLPVRVSRNCRLLKCGGSLQIQSPIRTHMIHIGYGDVNIFDKKYSRTIWEMEGTVMFSGTAFLGHGSKISVQRDALLSIGKEFKITAETAIVCFRQISFGDNCLLSWECMLADTDFHEVIETATSSVVNLPQAIILGNNVWIGCRCTILKGTEIADGCIVAAQSLVNRPFDKPDSLIGGVPASVLKSGVTWR